MKNPDVEALLKVDALDTKASKLRRELEAIPEDLSKHKERARKLAARVEALREEEKRLQKEIDKLALEVEANEEQAKKYQIQQNSVKTNEEYATLRKQIEALKKANGDLEEKELFLYEKIDALKAEERKAREELKAAEEQLRKEEAEARKEVARVEEELRRAIAEREEAEKAVVKQDILTIYRRVLEKTKGRAMAPVRDRICQGCFMEIPMNHWAQILGGKEIVLCKSCSRILYLEDEERAASATSFSVSDKDRDSVSKDGNW